MLVPFFLPHFYNAFQCFHYIMLVHFYLFSFVVPYWNFPTSLCSSRKMPYWYYTYMWYFCGNQFTPIGLTGNIFRSALSCCIYLIFNQKLHSIEGCLVCPLWFLLYHWIRYISKSLTEIGSEWSITTCTKDHLDCDNPNSMCLIKNCL